MHRLASAMSLAALILTGSPAPLRAATITILQGTVRSHAGFDTLLETKTIQPVAGSAPVSSGPVVAVYGVNQSTSSLTLDDSALQIEFTHARTGFGSGAFGYSEIGTTFEVSAPVTAVLSGGYAVTDVGVGHRVLFDVSLSNFSGTLHLTQLESRGTTNESFVVGQLGGDFTSFVVGSTSLELIPGLRYSLFLHALTHDFIDELGGDPSLADGLDATASGFVRIDFLPEPALGLLLAVGVVLLETGRASRCRAASTSCKGPRA